MNQGYAFSMIHNVEKVKKLNYSKLIEIRQIFRRTRVFFYVTYIVQLEAVRFQQSVWLSNWVLKCNKLTMFYAVTVSDECIFLKIYDCQKIIKALIHIVLNTKILFRN